MDPEAPIQNARATPPPPIFSQPASSPSQPEISNKSLILGGSTLVESFVEAHLSDIPDGFDFQRVEKLRDEISSSSDSLEQAVCTLLNDVGKLVHGEENAIFFFDHRRSTGSRVRHPWNDPVSGLNYEAGPVVLGIKRRVFNAYDSIPESKTKTRHHHRNFPWHHVETIVEIQSPEAPGQMSTYLTDINQARPDLVGAYGLFANKADYAIMWSDCTGSYKSKVYKWKEDLHPAIRYVVSLCAPPEDHGHHDEDICLDRPDGVFYQGVPQWRFPHLLPKSTFRTVFVGPAYSRSTRVFEEVDFPPQQKAPLIVKDYYTLRAGQRYDEAELLRSVHCPSDSLPPVAGCVRAIELRSPRSTTPKWPELPEHEVKTKQRMLCFDTGTIISRSESVLDFFKTVFDALEVHREVAMKRNILHRDISPGNVYGSPRAVDVKALIQLNRIMIKDIKIPNWCLTAATAGSPSIGNIFNANNSAPPLCMLADFHLAAVYPAERPEDEAELKRRTGTAMFTARAVQDGRYLRDCGPNSLHPFPQMPHLEEDARGSYRNHFGQGSDIIYDRYNKNRNKAGVRESIPRPHVSIHQPRHDVESFFWLIVVFLLQAFPADDAPESELSTEMYQAQMPALLHGARVKYKGGSVRNSFFSNEEGDYRDMLHPVLAELATFISKLADQVYIEWEYYEGLPSDDLHEAFRRLLMAQIFEMEAGSNSIPLQIGKKRKVSGRDDPSSVINSGLTLESMSSCTGSKRKPSSDADDRPSRKQPRN